MTTRQQTLLEDLGEALNAALRFSRVAVAPPVDAAEARRLRAVERAAESLVACAGAAAHWTEDEREGLGYLRLALYRTSAP